MAAFRALRSRTGCRCQSRPQRLPPRLRTVTKRPEPASDVILGGGLIRRNSGQVTAVGGRALRTPQGHPIRYVDDDIVIDLPDGSEVIYCGAEGRLEAIRDGVLRRVA